MPARVPLCEFRQEIQFGEEPVRLDMTINTEGPLSDPLGQGFRKKNIASIARSLGVTSLAV